MTPGELAQAGIDSNENCALRCSLCIARGARDVAGWKRRDIPHTHVNELDNRTQNRVLPRHTGGFCPCTTPPRQHRVRTPPDSVLMAGPDHVNDTCPQRAYAHVSALREGCWWGWPRRSWRGVHDTHQTEQQPSHQLPHQYIRQCVLQIRLQSCALKSYIVCSDPPPGRWRGAERVLGDAN